MNECVIYMAHVSQVPSLSLIGSFIALVEASLLVLDGERETLLGTSRLATIT